MKVDGAIDSEDMGSERDNADDGMDDRMFEHDGNEGAANAVEVGGLRMLKAGMSTFGNAWRTCCNRWSLCAWWQALSLFRPGATSSFGGECEERGSVASGGGDRGAVVAGVHTRARSQEPMETHIG